MNSLSSAEFQNAKRDNRRKSTIQAIDDLKISSRERLGTQNSEARDARQHKILMDRLVSLETSFAASFQKIDSKLDVALKSYESLRAQSRNKQLDTNCRPGPSASSLINNRPPHQSTELASAAPCSPELTPRSDYEFPVEIDDSFDVNGFAQNDMEEVAKVKATDGALSLSMSQKLRQNRKSKLQRTLWRLLENQYSGAGWYYSCFMNLLILLSVLNPLVQTVRSKPIDSHTAFVFEYVFDACFALDLCVRIFTWPKRKSFLRSIYNLIDASVLLSLGLRAASGGAAAGANVETPIGYVLICIIPVVRLLKLLRRFQTFQVVLSAFSLTFEALPALLFMLISIALSFASLLFYVESRSDIPSWPIALYLAVLSMTGSGFGDFEPKSTLGRTLANVLIITGLLYLAIPLGILGNAFTHAWDRRYQLLAIRQARKRISCHGFSAKDIVRLFRHFAECNEGEMEMDTFIAMIKHLSMGFLPSDAIELFRCIDVSGCGVITEQEFVQLLFPRDTDLKFDQLASKEASPS
eukprot:TRINITY_DN27473_c0_g1_i3.p1 TRINITY_DN27473_c0_g1~~TRINITY_DN27473_c0_g1_i3.p1  ORF type:complete len:534 (-),score=71.32 TRINITY_DN27473_c0_g1_i3:95-1669(-)